MNFPVLSVRLPARATLGAVRYTSVDVAAARGKTVILATHNLVLAGQPAGRTAWCRVTPESGPGDTSVASIVVLAVTSASAPRTAAMAS